MVPTTILYLVPVNSNEILLTSSCNRSMLMRIRIYHARHALHPTKQSRPGVSSWHSSTSSCCQATPPLLPLNLLLHLLLFSSFCNLHAGPAKESQRDIMVGATQESHVALKHDRCKLYVGIILFKATLLSW